MPGLRELIEQIEQLQAQARYDSIPTDNKGHGSVVQHQPYASPLADMQKTGVNNNQYQNMFQQSFEPKPVTYQSAPGVGK